MLTQYNKNSTETPGSTRYDEIAELAMNAADASGDGRLDVGEFCKFMQVRYR